VLDHLDNWLGGAPPDSLAFDVRRRACRKFQQLSAPVAAKAVEDTAFYRYGRLLSRNDVGFDAATLGAPPAAFHAACQARQRDFPHAMLATATHDHKRGEDVRARLAVLSEIPDEWAASVRHWVQANAAHRGAEGPTSGDEAMLYQMIVGAWPPALDPADAPGVRAFAERLADWQVKAAREAKLNTDWTVPNAQYEDAARDFLFAVLAPGSTFLAEAAQLARRIGPAGAVNGLAQALLKLTTPGVPDFYQGTEFWDFSLVDPDNRRPVDFPARRASLATGISPAALLEDWPDGRVKQAVLARVLALRRAQPALFAQGDYRPLALRGPRRDHALAFLRVLGDAACLIVAPRLVAGLVGDLPLVPPEAWADTTLDLPDEAARRLRFDVLAGEAVRLAGGDCTLASLLRRFPLAIVTAGASD
jgi:(1->4)-alpha-D-glucan 1-alpha-D-glucosylmutase